MEVAFMNRLRPSVHNATNHQPMHIHRPSKIKAVFFAALVKTFFIKVRQLHGWNMIYDLCYCWAFEAVPKDRGFFTLSNSSLQNSFIKLYTTVFNTFLKL
jgi:hypothetical protein